LIYGDVLATRGDFEVDFRVMTEEFGDVTDPDSDAMEGLLFDLGIFGGCDISAGLGGPRSRSGLPCQRTLSTGTTATAACGAPPSVSLAPSPGFGDDHLRQLTEKRVDHVLGESVGSVVILILTNLTDHSLKLVPPFRRKYCIV